MLFVLEEDAILFLTAVGQLWEMAQVKSSGGCVLVSLSNTDRSKRSHGELSFSTIFDHILNTNSEVILLLQAWLDKGCTYFMSWIASSWLFLTLRQTFCVV